jgi:pimeloyl-ACP methyl ester carboxylesterase
MAGESFQHRVFSRGHPGRGTLHVYIEGDGRAWLDSTTISRDPTPRKPLMLELMALDSRPSVYVGRPCYFGLADSQGCNGRHWTSDRYSPLVVASLQRVIETLVAEGDYDHVVLFGHSGGGTLATLLASRLEQVDALVTIAPNLDVAGWTALHGYSPLAGSLDPAQTNDFPRGILQVHWLGSDDEEIPPELIEALEPRLGDGQVRIHDGFDHRCCWSRIWPDQLDELEVYFSRTAARTGDAAAITTINGRETVRLEENLQ